MQYLRSAQPSVYGGVSVSLHHGHLFNAVGTACKRLAAVLIGAPLGVAVDHAVKLGEVGIEHPAIGLLNIGTEETKGNDLVK